LNKLKPNFDDYGTFLLHQKCLEEDAAGEYKPALDQIRRTMSTHPKDIKWVVQVTLAPHLKQNRLAELAREFLHVNIEYRILGHHQDIYGNQLLSCIIRN